MRSARRRLVVLVAALALAASVEAPSLAFHYPPTAGRDCSAASLSVAQRVRVRRGVVKGRRVKATVVIENHGDTRALCETFLMVEKPSGDTFETPSAFRLVKPGRTRIVRIGFRTDETGNHDITACSTARGEDHPADDCIMGTFFLRAS